jgi:hypothetical protein
MKRDIPPELHERVLELATAIAQPGVHCLDTAMADRALGELRALFDARMASSQPDPFLTETLADFVFDDEEAIRLYRLALQQVATFPGEPTHTKRIGLTQRLFAAGRTSDAREELERARREAFAAGDRDALKELDELPIQVA